MIIHQVRSFRDKHKPLHYRSVDVPSFTLLLYNPFSYRNPHYGNLHYDSQVIPLLLPHNSQVITLPPPNKSPAKLQDIKRDGVT